VFADPQRLNPGNITIVKSIVTPVVPAADCGHRAAAQLRHGGVRVPLDRLSHHVGHRPGLRAPGDGPARAGDSGRRSVLRRTDTLLNVEQLLFADGVTLNVAAGGGAVSVAVPAVVGLTQAAAVAALTGADFVAASVNGNSTTAAVGTVILQNPRPARFVRSAAQ
jgi:hypothetical protein